MPIRYLWIPVVALLVLAGCDQTSLTEANRADEAASYGPDFDAADKSSDDVVPGQYVVVFKNDVQNAPALAASLTSAQSGALVFSYEHALKGFTAQLSDQAAEALKKNPNVAYVEPDRYVYALAVQNNPPSWGLDRIDQRNLPLSNSYTYDATGAGVTAYILDTGIRTSHNDFGGRASVGFDAIGDGQNGQDCHGHGTHVAGTVGGTTYGVAKQVSLVAVRVLNCSGSGTFGQVIAGVDWVTANHIAPAVANMSLGGGAYSPLDDAVNNSIAAGVTYAVSAGNSNANACNYSPARAAAALTVGSTTITDARSSFSNYGTCVDLFAPGSSITSAWYTSDTATNTISGTSMASPHVAGVAALYLDDNPNASSGQVASAIVGNATTGVVGSPGPGSPNLLLYSLFGPPPPNTPPTAAFSFSASGLTVDFTDESTDTDGSVVAWSWNFGDGSTATTQNPSHTYAVAGTYSVTLTVTDDDGATDVTTQSVTVEEPPPSSIQLTLVRAFLKKNTKKAELSWSGATTNRVDIYLDGALLQRTKNDGRHTVTIREPGNGPFGLKVCEQNSTSVCSNEVFADYN